MMKYKKRPIIVEATQWFKDGDHDAVFYKDGEAVIKTLEGDMRVSPRDWIITGVQGENYPYKPDIFEKTYERVTRNPE